MSIGKIRSLLYWLARILGDVNAVKLKQIADDLTKRRIKTKMGNRQWSHQTIASILKR